MALRKAGTSLSLNFKFPLSLESLRASLQPPILSNSETRRIYSPLARGLLEAVDIATPANPAAPKCSSASAFWRRNSANAPNNNPTIAHGTLLRGSLSHSSSSSSFSLPSENGNLSCFIGGLLSSHEKYGSRYSLYPRAVSRCVLHGEESLASDTGTNSFSGLRRASTESNELEADIKSKGVSASQSGVGKSNAHHIGYRVLEKLNGKKIDIEPKALFAVVQIGSHQFKVSPGDAIYVEKLCFADVNEKIALEKVMLLGSKWQTIIGRPIIPDAQVLAAVEEHALDAKVIIFKKKRRKNYRRHRGHRQELTRLRILDIIGIQEANETEEKLPMASAV